MPRLSIDITAEEHQKLKAIAALKGQSIKEYVLNRTLGIDQARRGEFSQKSIRDIRREAREQAER